MNARGIHRIFIYVKLQVNIKLSSFLIKDHDLKTDVGKEIRLQVYLTSALDRAK
jgi:hypothetical protein